MSLKDQYPYPVKRIGIKGHDCAYIDEGRGTPMLFLPGFSVNLASFSPNYPHFASTRRVIGMDYPGYYLSEKKGDAPYSIPFMADGVVELIDKLALEKTILVGSSMGGAIAMETALKVPGRVAGLVLTAPAGFSGRNPLVANMISLQTLLLPHKKIIEKMFDRLVGRVDAFFYDKKNPFRDTIFDGYSAMKGEGDFALWIMTLTRMARSVLRADYRKSAGEIVAPTLIIWGEKDEVLPPVGARIAEMSLGKNARVVMFPDTGHLPFIEEPDAFMREVDGFLKTLGL